MMKYVKVFVIYILAITLVLEVLTRLLTNAWFNYVSNVVVVVALCGMLFHIGKLIVNMEIKRKYFIYMGIIVGVAILLSVLSAIMGIAVQDTWLGLIGGGVMLIASYVMFFDISRVVAKTNDKLGAKLQLIGVMGCIITVIIVPVIIIGLSAG